MWKETHLNLGTIKAKTPTQVVFEFEGDIEVKKTNNGKNYDIETSCGCTKGQWNPITKKLTLVYTPTAVSPELLRKGIRQYSATRFATVKAVVDDIDQEYKLLFTSIITQ